MLCPTTMPQGARYFIIEVNDIPSFVTSVESLTYELRGIFEQEYYGADLETVKLFEWHAGSATELWITNSKPAQFDSNDYAYPQWTIYKEATEIGRFSIQIDGRA